MTDCLQFSVPAFNLHNKEVPALEFMEPYSPYLQIEPPKLGDKGFIMQVISPPFMLMELMQSEFLCIDIKHNVINTVDYQDVHHLTLATWIPSMNRSMVVGRILMNHRTEDCIAHSLITLFNIAVEATGIQVNFFNEVSTIMNEMKLKRE